MLCVISVLFVALFHWYYRTIDSRHVTFPHLCAFVQTGLFCRAVSCDSCQMCL